MSVSGGSSVATRVIEIIVDAKNTSSAALTEAEAELAAFQASVAGIGSSLAAVGVGLLLAGGVMTGVMAGLVDSAATFDQSLIEVQNNTTMTDADVAAMRDTVLDLGTQAPVAFDALSEGFMHITNFGFNAADATNILNYAMESAVSTGGDTAQTANILAAALHEFNLPASDAAKVMDQLHLAAAEGNMTLEQFTTAAGPVFAWASSVGVPLDQTAAAFSALTRHGFSASEAATQVTNLFEHLIKPSAAATKELEHLSQVSGVDLTNAFSATELHAKGIPGIIDEVRSAMDKAGMSADEQTSEWMKLIPNIRGGAAAFLLSGNGAKDFSSILNDLDTQTGITDAAYTRMKGTLAFQWGVLGGQVHALAISLGEDLMPAAVAIIGAAGPLLLQIGGWIQANGQLIGTVAPLVAGFLLLVGTILTVSGVVLMVIAVMNPVTLVILAIVAVVTVLAIAWATNFLGIRDVTASVFGAIRTTITTVMTAVSAFWAQNGAEISAVAQAIWSVIFTIVSTYIHDVSDAIQLVMDILTGNWSGAWSQVQDILSTTWTAMGGIVKSGVDLIIGFINDLIGAWDAIRLTIPGFDIHLPSISVPGVGTIGGGELKWGGFSEQVAQIAPIPMLAEGGIFDSPTLGLFGEAGPEAVVPLSQAGSFGFGGGGGQTVNVYASFPNSVVTNTQAMSQLTQQVAQAIMQKYNQINRSS